MLASTFKTATQFRSETPIGNDQLRKIAPSIFATEAHESRSNRYAYIPTSTVLDGLRKQGFEPFFVAQSPSRVAGKREYTKHLLRLRHMAQDNGKGEAHEVCLINSHDGSCGWQLLSGVFVFMCMNGLVTGDIFQDFRVRHSGKVIDQVIEASYTVLDQSKAIGESVNEMKAISLTAPEQNLLAEASLAVRYPETDKPAPVTAAQLLTPHRHGDAGNSVWNTFNRIQENTTRGGLSAAAANGRRARTRGVNGIDQNTALNKALWTLAEGMTKLKGGN